ncbi:hypothetical protein WA026_009533 [Henosepilachna vigintioctopunctata]|uniref:Beta-1,4-mannosyl-glycoprotein 4-beta-N-acetylglucosaminyltransferase n=1 Tax=Henosepilachna vigintioctopunctata TaxID=420089 RepID=A0AAW1U559_9CUCU
MHIYKINCKRLCIFVIIQILLVSSYYYTRRDTNTSLDGKKISFINSGNIKKSTKKTYHTQGNQIVLDKQKVRDKFVDFNSSLCFLSGTDIKSMNRLKNSWTCNCKTGWHGSECGQPEVIWRALLKHRNKINIKGFRQFARRMLYIFQVDEFVENLVDIRINDLNEVIDLFILIENEGNRIEKSLKNNFLKKFHNKILYLQGIGLDNVWHTILSSLPSLENDDIILVSKSYEIPNKFALSFFKYYDKWPEPISLRLRWSVFGFFWKHPSKTKTEGVICSVKYMQDIFNSNFSMLLNNRIVKGLIIGDLNHYGGWYCEFCLDPEQIIRLANTRSDVKFSNWKELKKGIIDASYIEDLIGNGLYIDGKTELERSRKYQDSYFAPNYVLENSLQFDYLQINLYTKLDYYEG